MNLLHGLPYLNQLRCTGFGMGFQLAPLCPVVGLVVMINITQEQAIGSFVDDQPNIAAHPYRPEILVPCLVELVKAHAGIGRVDL